MLFNDAIRSNEQMIKMINDVLLTKRDAVINIVNDTVDDKLFYSAGEEVISAGWSVVDTRKNSRIPTLPDIDEGDIVNVMSMRLRTDTTKPPAPHTEASLLAAMEHAGRIMPDNEGDDEETEFGIGTPATRATTIEKMLEKEMVVRKGRALIPMEYGIKLISILPKVLQSPEMTGEWEARLSRISKGKESPEAFMRDIRKLTKDVIGYAVKQGNTSIKDATSVGACPLCGKPVRGYDTSYYCTNKSCDFRRIYKAVKGYHLTLYSITMRELLANGSVKTEKGTYTLIDKSPYIAFEYAPKHAPDFHALKLLLFEYGFDIVDKVSNGGGLWIAGNRHDEIIKDFIKDCKAIGCEFTYYDDSKALKHKGGWCLRVDSENKNAYNKEFEDKTEILANSRANKIIQYSVIVEDPVIDLIIKSGFEYSDKRSNNGSLWIIAGEKEGKKLVEQCKKLGVSFVFNEKGGRASKHRPAWYSKKM